MQKTSIRMLSLCALIFLGAIETTSAAYAAADDDYNFSWLDPDKKIYVLQNRRFRKAGPVHLYMMGGLGLGEPWRTVYDLQPRMGYWFNEDFGIEAFYSARFHSPNNTYKAMIQAAGTGLGQTPLIREVQSQFGVLFNWAPWYAKINVFNNILYFDWYFSLGLGTMNTQVGQQTQDVAPSTWSSENIFAVFLGTGQLFHLSEKVMARLDLLGHFYSAPIYGGLANAPTDKAIFSSFTFNVGIGLKL